MDKVYPNAAAALNGLLHDGMFIAAGSFGVCGIPELLLSAGWKKTGKFNAGKRRDQARFVRTTDAHDYEKTSDF